MSLHAFILFFVFSSSVIMADEESGGTDESKAESTALVFPQMEKEPKEIRALMAKAQELDNLKLDYTFSSADPAKGGMDCSGTIYYLLHSQGLDKTPRQSNDMYRWVWEAGNFHAVNGRTLQSWEFAHLQPGDLLFWSGTYDVKDRDPPVSHVMIFVGYDSNGRPVIFGASEGRRFLGKTRNGVGFFDWELPSATSTSRFLGYGTPPGLRRGK